MVDKVVRDVRDGEWRGGGGGGQGGLQMEGIGRLACLLCDWIDLQSVT